MTSSYYNELDDTFRGEKVRVHAAGHTYEGWARIWHYEDQSLLVLDAVRDDGEELGAVTLHQPEAVERLSPIATIEEVPVAAIHESPYCARSYEDTDHQHFIRQTRERGHLLTFPTVRTLNSDERNRDGDASPQEYEVVIGHRRVDTARKAGLHEIPVKVANLDDWETVQWFVDDHIPIPGGDEHGMYDRDEIDYAIGQLRKRWPDDRLLDVDPLAYYLKDTLASTRTGYLKFATSDDSPSE
jgi:hypothetical protein